MNCNKPERCRIALLMLWCCAVGSWAVPPSFRIDPPQFPDANTVRITLLTAPTNAIYKIQSTTNVASGPWITLVTGAVGQVVFDLPRPAHATVFYRADDPPPPVVGPLMSSNEVVTVIAQAMTRAASFIANGTATNAVVAVVDREGFVLCVWSLSGTPSELDVIDAITKAGSAAFLSSSEQAFTTRTAGFIVQQNFPPTIANKPAGPLVGVNFSNLSISDVNRFKDPHTWSALVFGGGGTNGAPVTSLGLAAISGLAGSPGGVPLYRAGNVIGGVGAVLTGHAPIPALADIQRQSTQTPDVDEDVALAGQIGFAPGSGILASGVLIDGIRLPYVASSTSLPTVFPLTNGTAVASYLPTNSPPVAYPAFTNFGGIANVKGELRSPIIGDPLPGLIDGVMRLTAAEVTNILVLSAQRAAITRAGIRLPAGRAAQVFITVVNNPGTTGVGPAVLGTFRTPDATLFSWDVSVQKARTAVYFSRSNNLFGSVAAISSRTVGFLSQSMYPPGIAGTSPGPWLGWQEQLSLIPAGVTNPLNGVGFASPPLLPDPSLPNGITIFPGGFPLYRDGKLVGAIGVSGDGIDQDDLIGASGTVNFLPPAGTMADNFIYRGARLPYAKFPRNPSL